MSQGINTSRPMSPVLEGLRKRGIRDGGKALLHYHLESEARNWHAWPGDYVDVGVGRKPEKTEKFGKSADN